MWRKELERERRVHRGTPSRYGGEVGMARLLFLSVPKKGLCREHGYLVIVVAYCS